VHSAGVEETADEEFDGAVGALLAALVVPVDALGALGALPGGVAVKPARHPASARAISTAPPPTTATLRIIFVLPVCVRAGA